MDDVALSALGVATIAAIGSIVTPLLTSWIRTREQKINWKRQDLVAAEVRRTATMLVTFNKQITEQNAQTQGTLNHVRTLVNSNLTEQKERTAAALQAQILMTEEVFRLNRRNGIEPPSEALVALGVLKNTAHALRLELAERITATDEAIAADKPSP
jgi:hypothetical protein